jgi:hypothetical protein
MILTDYYRFEKIALKSKWRLDCVASTRSYPEFEKERVTLATKESEKRDAKQEGALVLYFGDAVGRVRSNAQRRADNAISINGHFISSVYKPDISQEVAYGDFKGTSDALLFVFKNFSMVDGRVQSGSILEIFVARGESKDRNSLFNLLANGELDEEMKMLREAAVRELTNELV